MKGLLVKWLILTIAIMFASYMIDGIVVRDFFSAFFAAAILGVLNTILRPVLILLTLPINILTFGLFTFVINAFLLKIVSGVIAGFYVYGFWSAVFGSLVISVVNWVLTSFVNDRGRIEYVDLRKNRHGHWE